MIREALEFLVTSASHDRPPELKLDDGSLRRLVYDDGKQSYVLLPEYLQRRRTVSNVESLAAMVLEEARRLSSAGDWMTVTFSTEGAKFYLDDQDPRTVFHYKRHHSPQWEALVGAAGRPMEHSAFVRLLQRLRPSIVEFSTVLREFRKISFDAGIKIESAPTLEQGRAGNAYAFEVQARGGTTKAALPSSVKLGLQFARGSARHYELEAEVDIALIEKADKKAVAFTLILPDQETIAEQAIADEVAWFRQAVESLPLLSILEDY